MCRTISPGVKGPAGSSRAPAAEGCNLPEETFALPEPMPFFGGGRGGLKRTASKLLSRPIAHRAAATVPAEALPAQSPEVDFDNISPKIIRSASWRSVEPIFRVANEGFLPWFACGLAVACVAGSSVVMDARDAPRIGVKNNTRAAEIAALSRRFSIGLEGAPNFRAGLARDVPAIEAASPMHRQAFCKIPSTSQNSPMMHSSAVMRSTFRRTGRDVGGLRAGSLSKAFYIEIQHQRKQNVMRKVNCIHLRMTF